MGTLRLNRIAVGQRETNGESGEQGGCVGDEVVDVRVAGQPMQQRQAQRAVLRC